MDPKLGARFDGVKIYCAKDVLENAADGDFRWVSKLGNRGVVSISYAFAVLMMTMVIILREWRAAADS